MSRERRDDEFVLFITRTRMLLCRLLSRAHVGGDLAALFFVWTLRAKVLADLNI